MKSQANLFLDQKGPDFLALVKAGWLQIKKGSDGCWVSTSEAEENKRIIVSNSAMRMKIRTVRVIVQI